MYKIRDGFILRRIAGENVVIPSGEELDLNMMITLNDTGAFLWKQLERGAEEQTLAEALLEEYEVSEEQARRSAAAFLQKLRENRFLA